MICICRNSLLGILSLLLTSFVSFAQDTTSIGGMMDAARKYAMEQHEYTSAIRLGKKALQISPNNTEILVFVGRTYSWAGNVDSSSGYLQKAVEADSLLEDAYVAYTDVYYWNKKNNEALAICQKGLSLIPASLPLHIRKVKVLEAMGAYKLALLVVDTLRQSDKGNTEYRVMDIRLKDLMYKNKLSVKFDYAHFDKQFPDDWKFYSIEYANTAKNGAVALRINMADRFNKTGLQYEFDAYPKMSKSFHAYFNLGFSDQGQIFPHWRGAGSIIANLPHTFEAEVGARYLQYNKDVLFYTAYIGKYYKRFLFGGRVYLTPSMLSFSRSTGISARYYFGDTDDYINLSAFAGISPDDRRYNLTTNSTAKLKSYMGELSAHKSIRKINILSLNVSLLNQEYFPGLTGNQIQAGIGYSRRF